MATANVPTVIPVTPMEPMRLMFQPPVTGALGTQKMLGGTQGYSIQGYPGELGGVEVGKERGGGRGYERGAGAGAGTPAPGEPEPGYWSVASMALTTSTSVMVSPIRDWPALPGASAVRSAVSSAVATTLNGAS